MRRFLAVFISVFVAELGDKTQLATFLFATDPSLSRTGVFVASSLALVVNSLIAVLVGSQVSRYVSSAVLRTLAGLGFVIIGVWFLAGARR